MKAPEYLAACGFFALLFFVLDVDLMYQGFLAVLLIPGLVELFQK